MFVNNKFIYLYKCKNEWCPSRKSFDFLVGVASRHLHKKTHTLDSKLSRTALLGMSGAHLENLRFSRWCRFAPFKYKNTHMTVNCPVCIFIFKHRSCLAHVCESFHGDCEVLDGFFRVSVFYSVFYAVFYVSLKYYLSDFMQCRFGSIYL